MYQRNINKYICTLLLTLLAAAEAEASGAPVRDNGTPRLVVNIIIDQMRTDYLEAFMPLYGTEGFKKLMQQGVVFQNPKYPYNSGDCASASATLNTGASPCYNGIPASEWLSRETLRLVSCTTDTKKGLKSPASPANLLVSNVADELKIMSRSAAKVYSVGIDAGAAVFSAGHAADAAIWIDPVSGKWVTSEYYQTKTPAWIDEVNRKHSPAHSAAVTWRPMSSTYAPFCNNTVSEQPKPFSHQFSGKTKFLDYVTSAHVNDDVTEMALKCVSATALGQDNITDILNIQYHASVFRHQQTNDAVLEIQDTYLRLDNALATLTSTLERQFGKDHLLFVVSSTGYTDTDASSYSTFKVPSGTVYVNRTGQLLNMYLSAIYGQENYVEAYAGNQIYLNRRLIEQRRISFSELLRRAKEMLLLSDGISGVYTVIDLLTADNDDLRSVRNGFNANVSGDIIISVAPGWQLYDETKSQYHQQKVCGVQFPVIFYGMQLPHEVVEKDVSVEQIAPTICKSIHIRAPNACKSAPLY